MGEETAISWTDHTFNPWWGCWKIADECKNCYADDLANRYAPGLWGRTAPRRFFGDKHWNEPRAWNRRAAERGVRERVFVASMSDWAEVHPLPEIAAMQDAARAQLWQLVRECEWLDWLFLTKRIDDAARLLPWSVQTCSRCKGTCRDSCEADGVCTWCDRGEIKGEPWSNVWLGVTCGARASLPLVRRLRDVPAAVRFISCEPLLEEIPRADWDRALGFRHPDHHGHVGSVVVDSRNEPSRIDWLIVGNESGHKRRPAEMDWVRTARDAAEAHGVRFHFKQWVPAKGDKIHLPVLDGRQWAEFPNV